MTSDRTPDPTRWRHPEPLEELFVVGDHVVGFGGGRLSVFESAGGHRRALSEKTVDAAAAVTAGLCVAVRGESNTLQMHGVALPTLRTTASHQGPWAPARAVVFAVRADGAEFVALTADKKPSLALFAGAEATPRVLLARSWVPRRQIADRAAYAPDGASLAVALHPQHGLTHKGPGPLRLWSAKDGSSAELKGHLAPVLEVRFGPDGTLYSLDRMGVVMAWDPAARKVRWRFDGGLRLMECAEAHPRLAVSADGSALCAGIPGAGVFLLSAKDGRLRWSASPGSASGRLPVAFAGDGARVFVGDGVGVRIRDARSGVLCGGAEGPVVGVSRLVGKARGGLRVAVTNHGALAFGTFSALGQRGAPHQCTTNGAEQVWVREAGGAWRAEVTRGMLATSRDASTVAILWSSEDGVLRDLRTGALRGRVPVLPGRTLVRAALSGDGNTLALVHEPEPGNQDTAERLSVYSVAEGVLSGPLAEGTDYRYARTLLWDHRGERLVVDCGGLPRLFDVPARRMIGELHGSVRGLVSLCVSEDGAAVFGLEQGGVLHRWSLVDGAPTLRVLLPADEASVSLQGARGDLVVVLSATGAYVWDCARGEAVARRAAPEGAKATAAALDHDGSLALGCDDGAVYEAAEDAPSTETPTETAAAWAEAFVAAVERGERERALSLAREVAPGAVGERAVVERVRGCLLELELRDGVTDVHSAMSERWLAPGGPWRWQDDQRAPASWEMVQPRGDGRYLALRTGCDQATRRHHGLYLIDLETGRCVWSEHRIEKCAEGPGWHGGGLRWTQDGERLGASNASGVFVYEAFRGVSAWLDLSLGPMSYPAWSFTPDGHEVVVEGELPPWVRRRNPTVPFSALDVASDTLTNPTRALGSGKLPKGFPKDGNWEWLHCTPDGERLCAANKYCVVVCDLPACTVRFKAPGPGDDNVSWNTFSVDGRWYFDGRRVHAAEPRGAVVHAGLPNLASRWSPVDDLLALADFQEVVLFRARTGRVEARLACEPRTDPWDPSLGDARVLCFGADGLTLAVLTRDHTALVWSFADDGRVVLPVDPSVCGLALGPGNRTLACWSRDALWVWRLADAKLLQHLPLEDDRGLFWCDDAGHPLEHPAGNAAYLFARDPCFPVRSGAEVAWVGAFDTGLVVCPPAVRASLDQRLTAVLHDRVSWPLRWALGSDAVTVVDGWEEGRRSSRWPRRIPASVRACQDPTKHPRPEATQGF
jgi:hypothetical protein